MISLVLGATCLLPDQSIPEPLPHKHTQRNLIMHCTSGYKKELMQAEQQEPTITPNLKKEEELIPVCMDLTK